MSIIEETLRRLQEKQDTSSSNNTTTDISDLKSGENGSSKLFKRLKVFVKNTIALTITFVPAYFLKGKKDGRSNLFIKITIVLTLICAVSYFFLDAYQKRLQEERGNMFSNQDVLPLIKKKSPEQDDVAIPGTKQDDVALSDITEIVETGGKSIVAESEAEQDDVVMPDLIEIIGTKQKDIVIKPAPKPEVKKTGTVKGEWNRDGWLVMMESIQNINLVLPEDSEIVEPEEEKLTSRLKTGSKIENKWIKDGWVAMSAKGIDTALNIWNNGFSLLPQTRIILVVNVFDNKNSASKLLQKLGDEHYAFIVEDAFAREDSYYVISTPPSEELWREHDKIVKIVSVDRFDRLPSVFLKGNYKEKVIVWMHRRNENIIKEPGLSVESGLGGASGKYVANDQQLNAEEKFNHIKHLIYIGSYEKAIDTLKPVIESNVGTWELYFLMGTAYLGLGNLDLAERYLDRGIAVNDKQIQLWIQRAVLEQQKGNHETALQILLAAEPLDPAMPEIQLNIGYSSDALGGKNSVTVKAYRYFLELTRDNSAYLTVRKKVLDRLEKLVVIK
ncbi:MAG: tetratricopeptide repeat protein [Candidatus Anammoxibacter sp.]